ncbi:MAG TPA: FHA domain-containing protein [Verrucomicrobiae bacterium]|nr:FHA domain-containing protein [Verrucomicrobiae bacterium]
MAKLLIQSPGFNNQVINLNLGVNRFGRSPGNDFIIEHATISSKHCEIALSNGEVIVRDCGSTNGTYINGEPVMEATLAAGQILRLGDVDLLVESTDVTIAIPKFELPKPAPPIVLTDGSLVCPRHKRANAAYQCTHCREVMCEECVHRLRRRGGKLLRLCPLCSHAVEPIGGEKKKKKTFLGFLQRTVKLPFIRTGKGDE